MNDDLKQQVYQSLLDVFGIMFDIRIKPLENDPPREMWELDTKYVEAKIDIRCSHDKSFQAMFFFSEDLAKKIAVNFMAIEKETLDDKKMIDSVREAVNMAIGGLLGKIDPEAKCQSGIASASISEGFVPARLLDEPGACVYDSDYGYLWIDYGDLGKTG